MNGCKDTESEIRLFEKSHALGTDTERQETPKTALTYFNVVGDSDVIERVRLSIEEQSRYDAPVLITGETGTGKELAARGLHYGGSRADKPFVPINCATLTDDLFSSEVFGYVKGAFTDAKQDKQGLLAAAEKGTLFLDEVDSLPLKSQAALLRFLQEGEYRPVGSQKTIKANVRLIASVNCNLEERIDQGYFRQDLYYRLFILSVYMPPLRERIEDIVPLVDHFLSSFQQQYGLGEKKAAPGFIRQLQAKPWPGNVRELENMIHRLYLTSKGALIGDDSLPEAMRHIAVEPALASTHQLPSAETAVKAEPVWDETQGHSSDYDFSRDKRTAVERFEQQYVQSLLHRCEGNVTKAASLCGKERRAFGKLVKKYNINKYLMS